LVAKGATNDRFTLLEVIQGLDSLEAVSGGFAQLAEADQLRVLNSIQHTPFFNFVRATSVVLLYEDREVWELLGYEGSSFEHGGYLNRGFNDLDWLPEPRIEEYDGPEEFIEVSSTATIEPR